MLLIGSWVRRNLIVIYGRSGGGLVGKMDGAIKRSFGLFNLFSLARASVVEIEQPYCAISLRNISSHAYIYGMYNNETK